MKEEIIIGIDEVGRGPLAGPVTIGMVGVPVSYSTSSFKGIRDSKALSKERREEWFSGFKEHTHILFWKTKSASAKAIDTIGIEKCISRLIRDILKEVSEKNTKVLLDGRLRAPLRFAQETIVRGDQIEIPIMLASIVAKVRRDRLMERYGILYPAYGFEVHKGYGTKRHIEAIQKNGLSDIHRKSFCKKL